MGTFITGATPLPTPKINDPLHPPTGNPAEFTAEDWNPVWSALDDLRTHTSGWANVKAYGAKGDGTTDDSAAIQSAINAAQAAKGRVYIPAGTYLINTALSLASTAFGIAIEGESQSGTTLRAGAAIGAVFQFADTAPNGAFAFRNLSINGNHLAQKGIASTQIRYLYLDRVIITNTTVAAVDVAEGWDQNITASQFGPNDGDGLRLGTSANNVRLAGVISSSNAGWGVKITTGVGVNIRNCDFEANALGAIYMSAGSGTAGAGTLNVKDSYFEGNATSYIAATLTSGSPSVAANAAAIAVAAANVGHAIVGAGIPAGTTITAASGTTITMSANATSSATITAYVTVGITISAQVIVTDILVNGSTDPTVLAQTFPVSNVNVEGNTTTSHGATTFVSFANSAITSLRLVGNTHATAYSEVVQNPTRSLLNNGGLTAILFEGNVGFTGRNNNGTRFHDRAIFSTSPVTPDTSTAEEIVIAPSTNAAFTINAPANIFWTTSRPNYQYLVFRVRNALGGGAALGAFTWNAAYKMAAWTNPADGFSRSITFSWDLSSNAWVEISRTPADVPN